MKREKLDVLGAEDGKKLRIYFPWDTPPRVFETTGNSRPTTAQGPCENDWELRDLRTGQLEWIPGWYIASRAS